MLANTLAPTAAYMKLSASQTSLNSFTPGSFTKERLASKVYLDANRPFVAYRKMKDLESLPPLRPLGDSMFGRCSSQLKIFVNGSKDENGHHQLIFDIPSNFDLNKFTEFQAYCRGFLSRMRYQHRKKRNDAMLVIQNNAEIFVDCSKDPWFQLLWSVRPIIKAKFGEEEVKRLMEELENKTAEINALTSENDSYKQEIHRLENMFDEQETVPANDFRFLKIDGVIPQVEQKLASQKEYIEELKEQIKESQISPDEKRQLEDEIRQLKRNKTEQDKEINRLENQLEEYDEVNQDLESTRERVKRLRDQLTKQQGEHEEELVAMRNQWQKRMESIQEQLESETEAKAKLIKNNRELEKKLLEEKSHTEDTEISDSHVDEDVRMRRDLLQANLELDKLRAENELYQADNNSEELKQRISELESILETTQRKKDVMIGENATLKVKLENVTTSLEETENRHKFILAEKSKRLTAKKSELLEAQKKISELETQVNKQQHELSLWEQKYNLLESELEKTKHMSNGEPTSPFDNLERIEKDNTISRLENRIKHLESEKEKVQESLDVTLEGMEALQGEYELLEEKYNQERISVRKLKQKLVEYQERIDNAELRVTQSERRRADLDEDLDRVNKALEEARSEIAELHSEKAHLQRFHMTSGSLRRHESMRSLHSHHPATQSQGEQLTDSLLSVPQIDVQDCSDVSSSEDEEEKEKLDSISGLSSGASLTDIVRQNELLCQADRLLNKGKKDRKPDGSLSRSQSFRQISSLPRHLTGSGSGLQRTHSFQGGINKKESDSIVEDKSES